MITKEDLQKVKAMASSIKAVVIGDVMLDKYIHGVVERISPEAPVPILIHQSTELKAGGAANVALNLASWGCNTSLIGVIGEDVNGRDLISVMNEQKIAHHFFVSSHRPTTVKTRIVSSSHHLLRIDEESSEYISDEEETSFGKFISGILEDLGPDLVIMEDYNKGVLSVKTISSILDYCKKNKVFIAVDPKEKNFMNYHGADLFKPNLREAIYAAHKNLTNEDLSEVATEWKRVMNVNTIAITLGAKGVFLQNGDDTRFVLPDRTIDVIDVCGAGDAVICALALAQLSGLNLIKSGALANLSGAYVCSHSGVVPVDPDEIEAWI